ncbi:ATP-binding domain-containing protein [Solidesulfovibrio sp. C21]|uniref:ATP-binding domain-containing protein n=1 Tax=Solidesulfovibrio sp. C21 TaxID=3398613 RepID=UPI0039FBC2E2
MDNTWWVKQEDLDADQQKVIQLPLDGSFAIFGPPGSGKTNLLLLRANYLTLANRPNVLILSFTRSLREFITSGAHRYSFSTEKVKTYHRWAIDFLRENGILFSFSGDFAQTRAELQLALQDIIASEKISDVYDAILLDEAQDYTGEEINILNTLAKDIYAVGDLRQRIFQPNSSIQMLEALTDDQIELTYHYRNGLKICKFADGLDKSPGKYISLEQTSNYNETDLPSSVTRHKCLSLEEQFAKIEEKIIDQAMAYPEELIGIVCPRRDELNKIADLLRHAPFANKCTIQSTDGYISPTDDTNICLLTIHSAKGLEFRALHIAACDTLKRFPLNRNMLFTAATRAKTSLDLYHENDISGYIESALVPFEPIKHLPTVKDAFGMVK